MFSNSTPSESLTSPITAVPLKRMSPEDDINFVSTNKRPKTQTLCCNCGIQMEANPTGQCANCITQTVDITADIPRSIVLPHCRECNRYLGDSRWMVCERESKELLALCLKKIKIFQKRNSGVEMLDCQFLYTEEHSKRLRVKMLVQGDIIGHASQRGGGHNQGGAKLQQELVIEFTIANKQCEDCCRSYTPHTWKAAVQVRQKVSHRRTLMHLEQLILSHQAHEKLLFVSQSPEGLDFHFNSRSNANRFAEFVRQWCPTKTQCSRTLVSHDTKNNSYNYKYTLLVTIAPPCRDDLVFLPKKLSQQNGGISQLCLLHKVSTGFHLIDPNTLTTCEIASVKYWESPFETVLDRKHLTEFVVLEKEDLNPDIVLSSNVKYGKKVAVLNSTSSTNNTNCNNSICGDNQSESGQSNMTGVTGVSAATYANLTMGKKKFQLCEVEIARVSDLGHNDIRCRVRCHLGHILNVGDHVLGYDMRTVQVSGEDDDRLRCGGYGGGNKDADGDDYNDMLDDSDNTGGIGNNRSKKSGSGHGKSKAKNRPGTKGTNKSNNTSTASSSSTCPFGVANQDVILVRKKFLESKAQSRQERRQWELRRLEIQKEERNGGRKDKGEREDKDQEMYLQDLEENADMRQGVQMFRRKGEAYSKKQMKEEEERIIQENTTNGKKFDIERYDKYGFKKNNNEDDDDSDSEVPCVPMDELTDLLGELTVKPGGDKEIIVEEDEEEEGGCEENQMQNLKEGNTVTKGSIEDDDDDDL